ncbi:MAG: phage tail tape measure protein [Synergistaceae bacterium]|nr:phage tail tape measure protein [Synergistaceae bacterium]
MAGNFEMSILIGAALAGSFKGTFDNAGKPITDLQKRLDDLSRISGKINNYQKLTERVNANQAAFVAMRKEAQSLKKGLEKVPPEGSRESFEKLSKQADKLQQRLDKDKSALEALRPELTGAGVDLRDMASAQKSVAEQSERLINTQRELAEVQGKIDSARGRLAGAKGKIITSAAPLLAMVRLSKTAMDAESAMANIRKVVEFDAGREVEQLKEMKEGYFDLSKRIPMTAVDLMKIGESAGQLGIPKDEILGFTEDAAKMGVAFDISAEHAGATMASWRTALKLNQKGVVSLADKVNLLGNTTAASAPNISEVITRLGPLAEVGGITDGILAALGASVVATGTEPEVAATGLKNLFLALNAGKSATKGQDAAFAKLGYKDPAKLAKRMQEDSEAVMVEVLERIGKKPQHEQMAVIKDLLGKQAIAAVAPLLTNLEFLKENLKKVNDPSLYEGSMEKEFQARADTTENSVQLLKNSLTALSEKIGEHLLPVIEKAAEFLAKVLNTVTDLAEEFPGLTEAVTLAGAAWGTWKVFNTTVSLGGTAVDLFVNLRKKTELLKNATDAQAKSQGELNLVMSANPVFLVIKVIAALGAAFYYAYTHCEWFRNEVDLAWERLKTGAGVWKDKIKGALEWVSEKLYNISEALGKVSAAWDSFMQSVGLGTSLPEEVGGKIEAAGGGTITKTEAGYVYQGIGRNGAGTRTYAPDSFAEGGIFTKPRFGLFAEDGPESIIPHNPSGERIWQATGEMAGFSTAGGISFSPSISLTVNAGAGADGNAIGRRIIREIEAELPRMLKRFNEQQARVAY